MTRAGSGRPARARRWWLLLPAFALAWAAVREAALAQWGLSDPALAAHFAPAGGLALAAMAEERVASAGGAVDAVSRTLAAQALARDPAAAAPLVVAGLAASADGRLAQAVTLMRAAEARDPRDAVARFWLFDHAMRTGDYAAGVAEAGPAMHLRDGASGPILKLLAALTADPRGWAALRTALARDPDWRPAFFASAAAEGTDPAPFARLLLALPAAADPGAARQERQAVLSALVERGAVDQAYATWRRLLPSGTPASAGAVFDPTFRGLSGAAPFGWSLRPGENATARLVTDAGRSALLIGYGGGGRELLAEQYVPLSPGRYRLRLLVRSPEAVSPGDRLSAQLICASDAAVIARLPLDAVGPSFAPLSAPATVARGCGAVRVQFWGEAGSGAAATLEVTDVRLERA